MRKNVQIYDYTLVQFDAVRLTYSIARTESNCLPSLLPSVIVTSGNMLIPKRSEDPLCLFCVFSLT